MEPENFHDPLRFLRFFSTTPPSSKSKERATDSKITLDKHPHQNSKNNSSGWCTLNRKMTVVADEILDLILVGPPYCIGRNQ